MTGEQEDRGEPAQRSGGEAQRIRRRRFLALISLGISGLAGAFIAVPWVGFVLAPLFRKTHDDWRDVGSVDSFTVGETVKVTFVDASSEPWAGVSGKTGAWLRRESQDNFTAFSINCTHLGCPVRWLPGANLFMCPCHGGVFYEDGCVAASPPREPLVRYQVRVQDGQVQVRTAPLPIITK